MLRGKHWIGRWREDMIGADGVVRRVRRSVVLCEKSRLNTKRSAERLLAPQLSKVNSLDYRATRVATVVEFVHVWREKVLCQHKPSSARAAESHLKLHILPTLGGRRLDEVTPEAQQDFVAQLSKILRRKTVLNILATLSSMFRKAQEWGYLCTGVKLRALVLPAETQRSVARFFSAEETRRIIAAAREPYATAFAVVAMTGVRSGELFGLKVEDLDFQRRLINIRRSVWYGKLQLPKSRASERALPLPEALVRRLEVHLRSWRPNPARLLFATSKGTPLSANNVVQRKLWPILDGLGIERCGFHAFRHTMASLLVDLGAPASVAQAQLGHSDPRITLGIYSHAIQDSQRSAVDRVAGILDPIGPRTAIPVALVQ
jgi:integrase